MDLFPMREDNYSLRVSDTLRLPRTRGCLVLDLFAGCGGLSLGFESVGFETIGYEVNKDCCATYEHNLESVCHCLKLTENTKLPSAPVLIGGPPCQPFSRRGLRIGANDERNGFPVFIAAVRALHPDLWMFENVKGLSEQNAKYFHHIVEELKSLGYIVENRVFRISLHDVPQRRERLVVVGHHGGFQFPNELPSEITAGEALGHLAAEIPNDAVFLTPEMDKYVAKYEAASQCRVPRDLHLDRPARTLTCRNLAGATSDMQRIKLPDGRRRRLTVREAARLQSFPDWFEFEGSQESRFTQIGNAVPPMFARRLALSVRKYMEDRKYGK